MSRQIPSRQPLKYSQEFRTHSTKSYGILNDVVARLHLRKMDLQLLQACHELVLERF